MQNLGLAVRDFKANLRDHSTERGVSKSVLVTADGCDKSLADKCEQHKDPVDLKSAALVQNLGLAVRGFKAMLTEHGETPGVSKSVLVIAGGYDKRLAENREHYGELVDLIAEYSLQDKVSAVMCLNQSHNQLCGLSLKLFKQGKQSMQLLKLHGHECTSAVSRRPEQVQALVCIARMAVPLGL